MVGPRMDGEAIKRCQERAIKENTLVGLAGISGIHDGCSYEIEPVSRFMYGLHYYFPPASTGHSPHWCPDVHDPHALVGVSSNAYCAKDNIIIFSRCNARACLLVSI